MRVGAILVILGIIAVVVGFLSLTQATTGMGLIGIACFLGIVARILQADHYGEATLAALQRERITEDV